MSLTTGQQTAINNLQSAIDAALAVPDGGSGNYHRALVEKISGTEGAIELLEPNWTGFKSDVADPTQAWSAAHPSH